MALRTISITVLALLLVAGNSPADTASPELDRLIKQLDSDDARDRDAATNAIAGLAPDALPPIEATLKRPDLSPEARTRLEQAIEPLRRRDWHEKRWRQRVNFYTATIPAGYEYLGRRNPKWDAAAREALQQFVTYWNSDSPARDAAGAAAVDAAERATTAGCDDPMLVYVDALLTDYVRHAPRRDVAQSYADISDAMATGPYHPFWKAWALYATANSRYWYSGQPAKQTAPDVLEMVDRALAYLPQIVADPKVPNPNLGDLCWNLVDLGHYAGADRKVPFDKVDAALAAGRPDSYLLHVLRGQFYLRYAWDARGGGWANGVPQNAWPLFSQRLASAADELEIAYRIDPRNPGAPTIMIEVEEGQGLGRDRMELWFRRAMEADPDNYTACDKKLHYLGPWWHGSREDMLAFGRQLLKDGNWRARLPLILSTAHWQLATIGPNGFEKEARPEYFKDPEAWADMKAVYDGLLAHAPTLDRDRSFYAKIACLAGQWTEADRQFRLLDDRADVRTFGTKDRLDALREEAARRAQGSPAPDLPDTQPAAP